MERKADILRTIDLPPSHPDCPRCNLWAAFAEMIRNRDEPTFLARRREILGDDA